MKKLIAVLIILNVFLSSSFVLIEKVNGTYTSFLPSDTSDSNDSKKSNNPIDAKLLSEKDDNKSEFDFNLKNITADLPAFHLGINFYPSDYFNIKESKYLSSEFHTPLYILFRSIII